MDFAVKTAILALIALALLAFGAVVFFDGTKKTGQRPADPFSSSSPVEEQPALAQPSADTEIAPAIPAGAAVQNPQPAVVVENPSATPVQVDEAFLRDERRRLARSILEEFRKPENATPDYESTTHPALFLPDGSPVDPHMLPPLQLPAAMTVENPAVEITTDLQVGEWERLQDEFIAEVGGKLPTDPDSRKTWIKAQRGNDERFRLKFGTEAFLRQQMDAYRSGLQPM